MVRLQQLPLPTDRLHLRETTPPTASSEGPALASSLRSGDLVVTL